MTARSFNVGPAARARLAAEHAAERVSRREDLERRLAARAVKDPEGIWSDLLDDLRSAPICRQHGARHTEVECDRQWELDQAAHDAAGWDE